MTLTKEQLERLRNLVAEVRHTCDTNTRNAGTDLRARYFIDEHGQALLDALDAAESAEPVAWVIPGDDNAQPNGAIDAMAWREGEFSRPLYTAPPAPSPVAVRPLEWRELTSPRDDGPPEPTGDIEALTMIGEYSICIDEAAMEDGGTDWKWCVWTPVESLGHFADIDQAKAAAQVHYEARIRSALVSAPPAPAIPEGWVQVPKEPTDAMLAAVWAIHASNGRNIAAVCYEAMLSAAPTGGRQ